MTAHLDLDEAGAPVSITDVAGANRRLTAWGVVDVGAAAALILTDGTPPTVGQAQAIAGRLDPDTVARVELAEEGRRLAIDHARTWEAQARATRRPPTRPIRPVVPSTEPIRAAPATAPATEPATVELALPRSGATALSVARGRVDWVDLDQPTGPPADLDQRDEHDEHLVAEQPRRSWVDVLALLLLAALGIAGIIAGVAFDSLVVGIFGGCCAGAALGIAVGAP